VLGSRREGAARRRHGDMVRARWQMAAPRARGSIVRPAGATTAAPRRIEAVPLVSTL
jgi:hypothetical protein